MCIPKQIVKSDLTTINEGVIENRGIEDNIIDIGNVVPELYVPSKFEKLLSNISNKLGLSFSIFQK